jgi:Raf kinase inhibitor-like YbhB/YbcL family protein
MRITSPTFTENAVIPDKYGCHGANINPALEIKSVPANAKSLALILDDPDASGWSHWILWNIDPKTTNILENYAPAGAVSGLNDFGANNYGGPCPPSGSHRYEFTLYALDTVLNLPAQTDKTSLIKAFNGHILDSAKLTGIYKH